ncbi:integrase arm-type DNA-binding domain-containing protein [Sulfurimonas sp. CS5]|jgi:hypothetical protein|uniref:integrase arm-type DNA-binding domain-containing protein n=1 Tax=Sulfurimonas sp. CS5 TaxID=3391145 RepID=UPI0039E9C1C7
MAIGLSLLIKTDGTKLCEFRFTSPTKLKRRKSSLGKFPDVPSSDARLKAQSYRELISQQIDPIDKKQEKELAPSTYVRKVGQFENDVKPFFKGRLISSANSKI